MKRIIHFSILMTSIVLFTGCSKVVFYDDDQPVITGSWILTDAAHKDAYGWYPVLTGVEHGVFHFYSNGTARYTERGVTMTGTWRMVTEYGGYYDEYGNYYNNSHSSLQVNLADYYGSESINMYFDHVRVYGNRFVATNYNNHYIERYRFERY
jgi:hypothetical protein